MFKNAFFFLVFLFSMTFVHAQEGCHILVRLDHYSYDTLWLGHTFGKRAVPEIFGVKNSEGYFELRNETPMPSGMYAFIHKRSSSSPFYFFQCWLADGQREFTLETDLVQPYKQPFIKGSPENAIFYSYLDQFEKLDDQLDSLINDGRYRQDETSFRRRVQAEEALRHFQDDFIRQHPGTLTAGLAEQTLFPLPPPAKIKPADWQQESTSRWLWQRRHYFDRMDISQPGFLQYPQWLERTDFFLLHLPPPSPDTTKALIDEVFNRLSTNPEGLMYYEKYLVNSLGRMSQFQLDEVFVYVVRNYIQTGKAPWTEPGEMQKLVGDAGRMEPLFVGKKAPDITLYDRKNNPVSLYEVQAPVTLMVFWLPDCSHCKRELPLIKRVYERYHKKGLQVVSVCGKYYDDTPACWEFADEKEFPAEWYTVSDPQRRSNMATLFNLRTFPRIFILDADKQIVYKRAGEASELELESAIGKLTGVNKQ